jgi:hypothetical protein
MPHQPGRFRTGQSTLELLILVVIVVIALVTLGSYIQRSYQGYLRNAASSHGTQFDPTRPFLELHQLNKMTEKQHVSVVSGQAAVDLFKGDPRITNPPGGSLPSRTLATTVHVESAWDIQKDKLHEAQ